MWSGRASIASTSVRARLLEGAALLEQAGALGVEDAVETHVAALGRQLGWRTDLKHGRGERGHHADLLRLYRFVRHDVLLCALNVTVFVLVAFGPVIELIEDVDFVLQLAGLGKRRWFVIADH